MSRISVWIGIVAALGVPLVPVVYALLHPPKKMAVEEGILGLAMFAFDMLGSISQGITILLWVVGLAAVAVVASLVAFGAAWVAREPRRTKLMCWLPVLLAALGYGVLVVLEG